jgi:hypothetical protein
MRARVEGAVTTGKGPDRNDVRHLEQCAGRFEARRRVMIAGDERDARMRTGDAQVAQCVVEQPLGVGGRIETVKNVARHDDRIDRPVPGDGDKLRQRVAVLGVARPALQRRAKMPVGRVKKANHSGSRQQAVGRGQGPRLAARAFGRIIRGFRPDLTEKDELGIGERRQFCVAVVETTTCRLLFKSKPLLAAYCFTSVYRVLKANPSFAAEVAARAFTTLSSCL